MDREDIKAVVREVLREDKKPARVQTKKKPVTKKQKLEFSKRLAIVITVLFVGTWVIGWGTWIFKQTLPTEMLDYITMPFSIVITGYFAKSGVENYTKIKNSADERDGEEV